MSRFKIKIVINEILLLKIILFLQVVNYTLGVVILKGNVIFKFSRDILLILLIILVIKNKNTRINKLTIIYGIFICFLIAGFIYTIFLGSNFLSAINVMRRYIFPIMILFVTSKVAGINRYGITRFVWWLLLLLSISAIWGVFQAWILKDDFLISLGYPTSYLYSYGKYMLGYSYYFGGLGIQRVVSTFSNSNVCGLVYGMTIIVSIFLYPYINFSKKIWKDVALTGLVLGYILTFSRSNFLAAGIVVIGLLYKYIPSKRAFWSILIVSILGGILIFIVQGKSSLVYKLAGWVVKSLNGTEDSVAGRQNIWRTALLTLLNSPQGIGFGKVGALAAQVGSTGVYYASENSYLAVGLDTGVLGLMSYVLCLIVYEREAFPIFVAVIP